ncbi:MAG TPA: HAD-IA family hydrolase [Candidatus Babeliales bacterium]|nr:HAD-IA family hydrolase [Candidatus Babeliales bacterium]
MRMVYQTTISLLFILSCTSIPRQKNSSVSTSDTKQAIIFDLNLLIKENQMGFAKKIGYGTLANYTLTHWKHPGYRCLDMLAAMSKHESQKPHVTLPLQSRIMPRCIVELQEGKKNCADTKKEVLDCAEILDNQKFFGSAKEKNLMLSIMNVVLDPDAVASIIEPIKQMTQLIQKLKNAGHKVYFSASTPQELYEKSHNKFPDFMQLFDGVSISAQAKAVKTDELFYTHLLNTHNLDPQQCILVDDIEESAAVAKKLGMQTVVCDKACHVTKQLKKYGIRV